MTLQCKDCEKRLHGAFDRCPKCGGEVEEAKPRDAAKFDRVVFRERQRQCYECSLYGTKRMPKGDVTGCTLLDKPCEVEDLWVNANIEQWCPNGGPRGAFPRSVTVGITAFDRPDKLRRCLTSLWARYPSARVIVADNGCQHVDAATLCPKNGTVRYVKLPYDAGLSACRNAIVDRLETPLLLLMEDDFVVDERCNLDAMLDVVTAHPDIGVCGAMHEMSYRSSVKAATPCGFFGTDVVFLRSPAHHAPRGTKFHMAEFVSNFALFRREFLATHRWKNDLKVGEHIEFYLRVRREGRWLVAFTGESQIGHDREGRDSDYKAKRGRAHKLRNQAIDEYRSDCNRPIPPAESRCVIVATCGRSGSSLLSGILDRLGVQMANQFVPPHPANPKGYYEDQAFHELLSGKRQCDFAKLFQSVVDIRCATRPLWGVKAPRFVSRWSELTGIQWPDDVRVIQTLRDPKQIAKSIERVGWSSLAEAKQSVAHRLRGMRRFLPEARARGWPVMPVEFDDLIHRPEQSVQAIVEFLDLHPTDEQFESAIGFVEPALSAEKRAAAGPRQ